LKSINKYFRLVLLPIENGNNKNRVNKS
jgi:hypothetical protein